MSFIRSIHGSINCFNFALWKWIAFAWLTFNRVSYAKLARHYIVFGLKGEVEWRFVDLPIDLYAGGWKPTTTTQTTTWIANIYVIEYQIIEKERERERWRKSRFCQYNACDFCCNLHLLEIPKVLVTSWYFMKLWNFKSFTQSQWILNNIHTKSQTTIIIWTSFCVKLPVHDPYTKSFCGCNVSILNWQQ